MSGKGGQDRINLRHQAMGMMMTGKSSREVGKVLGVDHSSVSRWYKRYQDGESLLDRKRSGRPTVQTKVSKLVLAKSLTKKRQSTRKLAERLSRSGHHMSHMTVHNYLTKKLGAKAFKRPKIPKLTKEHVQKRLNFCRERLNWTVDDWKKVIWSDESPYALFAEGNSKNDVIWTKRVEDVEPIEKVKFSPKVMVWGAMTSTCLSELHIVPQNTSINADYYQENILGKNLLPMFDRRSVTGPLTGRKCPEIKSEMIFMQDGARCHTAATTIQWLEDKEINYWGKAEWPPNSPDLNPIENLWSILEETMKSEKDQPKNIADLEKLLQRAWKKIKLDTLENLVKSMPDRVRDIVKNKGYYVIK